ncbi:sulfotransferase 2A1-like [Ruditapes philippinarum]|uniref:sulfotransferase 2A1-like n=1 Tax=Ruditapes philippinarum TaxID=129788 RepID=UPI00295B8290|nr:sulfotransferase 2A1-like [Ruditapes philippinarum]
MEWRTVEIRDEKGDGFDTVQCEDMVFPKQFLHIQPDVRMKDIKEFKYRDGDVLICSYPKTGTHWVFNLVHFLMAPGPVEQKIMPSPRLIDLHPLAEIEQLTSPRVAITHLKPNRLPVEHLQARGKIILLARNPRDTMVSHMYHTQRHEVFNFSKLSWDCFFDNWTKGQIPTGSYFDYYNSWEKSLQEQNTNLNVHIVFYENLIKDGLGELKKLQQFLGVTNTEDRLNQILDRCSWRRIKVDVKTGEQPAQPDQSELTRKGVIGHWRSKFTVSQDEMFNKILEQKFKNSMFNKPI